MDLVCGHHNSDKFINIWLGWRRNFGILKHTATFKGDLSRYCHGAWNLSVFAIVLWNSYHATKDWCALKCNSFSMKIYNSTHSVIPNILFNNSLRGIVQATKLGVHFPTNSFCFRRGIVEHELSAMFSVNSILNLVHVCISLNECSDFAIELCQVNVF